LSYASQDAEAAQKIAEALHAGGIEVFLDQSELRGGDAWDQKIRKQIKTCALFIPIISQKETFDWLNRAWSSRDPGMQTVLYDPLILRYKDDPRFAAFCKKVGLPTPAEVGGRT
jgi:hypothetical protein